jgi:hypothetical protein
MWTCPKCGEKVDPSFEVCWQCGTSADGVEDPDFVRADDAPAIEDPLYDPIAEPQAAAAAGPTEEIAGASISELVECYQALTLMEAKFLADQLASEGIPAMADTQDLQDSLGSWQGNPRVYCRAADLPRARAWVEEYDRRRKADLDRDDWRRMED